MKWLLTSDVYLYVIVKGVSCIRVCCVEVLVGFFFVVLLLLELPKGKHLTLLFLNKYSIFVHSNICQCLTIFLRFGISLLGSVIENLDSPDLVNRACRTIANLAQNPLCCAAVHDQENLTREIVSHLNKTTDENLQLTVIRALR